MVTDSTLPVVATCELRSFSEVETCLSPCLSRTRPWTVAAETPSKTRRVAFDVKWTGLAGVGDGQHTRPFCVSAMSKELSWHHSFCFNLSVIGTFSHIIS